MTIETLIVSWNFWPCDLGPASTTTQTLRLKSVVDGLFFLYIFLGSNRQKLFRVVFIEAGRDTATGHWHESVLVYQDQSGGTSFRCTHLRLRNSSRGSLGHRSKTDFPQVELHLIQAVPSPGEEGSRRPSSGVVRNKEIKAWPHKFLTCAFIAFYQEWEVPPTRKWQLESWNQTQSGEVGLRKSVTGALAKGAAITDLREHQSRSFLS